MSQYYQSNQAYNPIESNDGLWNGAIIGGTMGLAAGASADYFGGKGVSKFQSKIDDDRVVIEKKYDDASKIQDVTKRGETFEKLNVDDNAKFNRSVSNYNNTLDAYNGVFGDGRKRAIAYGVSAVFGIGLGMGIDSLKER